MNIKHNIIWVAIVFLCNTACTVNTIKKDILSRIESSGQYIDCYKNIESDPSDYVTYCGTCSDIPGRWKGGMSFCEKKQF